MMKKIKKFTGRCAQVILGVNSAYHESAAAIVIDGRMVAAVEEERFSGYKHGKLLRVDNAHYLPIAAIDYCLKEAGITWQDLDAVAYSLDPALRKRLACVGSDGRYDNFGHPLGESMFQRSLTRVPRMLRSHTAARLHFVPHHDCHAWYALGTSSFEQAAILVMDGIGEGASVSLGQGDRRQLQIQHQSLFPHSVGLVWEKVTRFLGLTEYDACKVMALAGLDSVPRSDTLAEQMRWSEEGLVVNQQIFDLEHPEDYSGLEHWFGCKRQETAQNTAIRTRIAAALQRSTEEVLLAIANDLHEQTNEQALVYAGGVALNCRANAELAARGPFSQIHIGPAAHDAGTAAGAAWHVYTRTTGLPVPDHASSEVAGGGPIPGTPFPSCAKGWKRKCTGGSFATVARCLVEGETIGWLDGRCEFGPRSLGRRSLLASPFGRNVVERVNRLKGRHWFEPLALSVSLERAEELFDIPAAGCGLTPYMLITVKPQPSWFGRLTHLLHADGTVRLQTVSCKDHPRFHALLLEIQRLTGIPLLINTSFNPRGRPMPASIEQALPLADDLGIRYMVVDGACWSKARQAVGAHIVTAIPDQRPEFILWDRS